MPPHPAKPPLRSKKRIVLFTKPSLTNEIDIAEILALPARNLPKHGNFADPVPDCMFTGNSTQGHEDAHQRAQKKFKNLCVTL